MGWYARILDFMLFLLRFYVSSIECKPFTIYSAIFEVLVHVYSMGIIIRQSLKQSLVSFLAIGVAFIAHIFIYTIDESATYGAASRIISIVLLLYSILLFGIPNALVKFYGEFGFGDKGYLANFLVATLPIMGSFFFIFWIFKDQTLSFFELIDIDTSLLIDYAPEMLILIITMIFFRVIAAYLSTQKRIVWPGLFDSLWPKFALGVLVLAIIFDYLPDSSLSWGLVIYYVIGLIAIICYAIYIGKFDLRWNRNIFKGKNLYRVSQYSGYTGLASFGATFAQRIDIVMVATLAPATAAASQDQLTGVFSLFLFLAGIVEVPARAVSQISGPIISQANDRGDIGEISLIYQKSSITLFLIGVALFALIFLSIEDLFSMTGRNDFYKDYFILFTIMGLVKMISTTLSTVNLIVLYSKYYRYAFYLTLFMSVGNVLLNYYFITAVFKATPLTGVAIATSIALATQYLIKVIFVRIKFGIHPFNIKMLVVIGAALICFGLASLFPSISMASVNPIVGSFLSIIIRTILFAIPFVYLVYTFKVSEDMNNLMDQLITRIKNRDFKKLI